MRTVTASWHTTVVVDQTARVLHPSPWTAQVNPHIAYCSQSPREIKYASWNGTDWIIETVDSNININYAYISLALTDSDKLV